MNKWKGKCCVTGVDLKYLLEGSHIVPWSESTDEEKIDHNNGLLLCPQIHTLFDKHLISFSDEGNMLISPILSIDNQKRFNISVSMKITVTPGMIPYLRRHRKKLKKHRDR